MRISVLMIVFLLSFEAMAFLPPSFRLEFEQSYRSQLSNKLKKSKGVIEYVFPSNIRFETKEPKDMQSVFVSNSKKTWIYTPPFVPGEKGEVVVNPRGRHMLAKFFDSLKKGLVNNELYTVVGGGDTVTLEFRPEFVKQLKIQKALFTFPTENVGGGAPQQLGHVKELKLIYDDGKTNQFTILSFDQSPSFSSRYFEFSIPAQTNVVEH